MKTAWRKFTAILAFHLAWFLCGPEIHAQGFVHPGGLHTKTDLDRMKSKVAAGDHPWIDGWKIFVKDPKAQNTYKARPAANMGTRQRAQDDATAMYYNALRWYISGDTSYAECAVRIANNWAATVRERPYGDDLSGIPIGSFALAAEVLRVYPGWTKVDFDQFKAMMVKYWYPKSSEFLKNHRGGPVDRCWANGDACNMLAVLGIGVLCDDRAKFDEAVDYFKDGKGMGSIQNAVPVVFAGGLGQWQEAGRDFAHTMGGQGLLAEFCQTSLNQGVDLFSYDDHKLLKGAEYAAQYTLWQGVPYTFYNNSDQAKQYYVSTNYHGRLAAAHFELLYNHYVVRNGLKAPNVKRFAELRRPEPGETDIFGYGTLTFTLDAAASPYPAFPIAPVPQDLTATPGLGRVDLQWSPSGAYTAHGYNVSRSTARGGPYESIYSTNHWTTPHFTDTMVTPGTTFYYVVSALNQTGASANSAPVSATPVAGGALPAGWTHQFIGGSQVAGNTTYAAAANGSFVIEAAGNAIGGTADDCSFAYQAVSGDFTITARLIARSGDNLYQAGVMMREKPAANSKMVAMTLGEIGGRQARFCTRAEEKPAAIQRGNDYTWLPIWLRLQRVGNTFIASQSPDGSAWFTVGKSSVAMDNTYWVGLAVAAGTHQDKGAPLTAAFDNVITGVTPPPVPAAPGLLAITTPEQGSVELTWQGAAGTPAGLKIEHSTDNENFYEIADLAAAATRFVNTGLSAVGPHHYRIRAYNTGGLSGYSNCVGVKTAEP